MPKLTRFVPVNVVLVLALSACNLPASEPMPGNPGAVLTAAAQTVAANLTQSAILNPKPIAVIPTSTASQPPPTFAAPPINTPAPPTPTQDCDDADFVADITIPDGTTLAKDEAFTKTWRLKNTGTCSWTPSYAVVFNSGDSMSGPAAQALAGNVNPGQTVDLSVNLKAPSSNGNYKGWWGLRNAAGVMFAQFYVEIKVSGGGGDGGVFAVTSISYTLSTWGDAGHVNCPRVIASITTNKPGTVTFKWKRKDSPSGGAIQTLVFASAGTQTVNYDWARGSVWAGTPTWVGIYVNEPNHQDFGEKDFTSACTIP